MPSLVCTSKNRRYELVPSFTEKYFPFFATNHRIAEWWKLEGISGGQLVPQIIIDLAIFAVKIAAISVTDLLAIFSFLTI